MNKIIKLLLVVTVILAFFQPSSALGVSAFPGLIAGMSFSSGSGISSGISISSSTNIVPSQSTPVTVTPSSPSSPENIPPQWIIGTREGYYLDPVSQLNWVYDKVLKKFYSPSNGWFLVTQLTPDGKPFAQFYYDPKLAVFIDMATGASIQPGQSDGVSTGKQTPQQNAPAPQQQPSTATQTAPVTPKPNQVTKPEAQTNLGTTGTQQQGTDLSNPCRISCKDCSSGYCDDCNGNGKCDNKEASGDNTGISETPQVNPMPTQPPSSDTGISEAPQGKIMPKPATPVNSSSGEGLSEDPQSTILYYKDTPTPDSGYLVVIACKSGDTCEFCLDNDGDAVCSSTDCAIIETAPNTYCVDCNRDGKCDSDKIFISDCTDLKTCMKAGYCEDKNKDGICGESV